MTNAEQIDPQPGEHWLVPLYPDSPLSEVVIDVAGPKVVRFTEVDPPIPSLAGHEVYRKWGFAKWQRPDEPTVSGPSGRSRPALVGVVWTATIRVIPNESGRRAGFQGRAVAHGEELDLDGVVDLGDSQVGGGVDVIEIEELCELAAEIPGMEYTRDIGEGFEIRVVANDDAREEAGR